MEMNIRVIRTLAGAMLSVVALIAASDTALARPGLPGAGISSASWARSSVVGVWESVPGTSAKRVDSVDLRADGTFELRFAYYCPPGAMCFVGPRAPDHGTWTRSGRGVDLTGAAGTYSGSVHGDVMELDGETLRRAGSRP
ncbi:hypothetical protein [Streptomyces xanthochromogenes]|uniref:hypothetical protein n=1 Tax=Streptomyces xanthochromogenes TaxID=67384 RepID=UPI003429B8D0